MPQIEININTRTGKTEIIGYGFIGGACSEAIRPYLEKLGTVEQHTPKEESAVIEQKVEQRI